MRGKKTPTSWNLEITEQKIKSLIKSQTCNCKLNSFKRKITDATIGGSGLSGREVLWLRRGRPLDLDLKVWAQRTAYAKALRQLVA